jgi:hypothetical protein
MRVGHQSAALGNHVQALECGGLRASGPSSRRDCLHTSLHSRSLLATVLILLLVPTSLPAAVRELWQRDQAPWVHLHCWGRWSAERPARNSLRAAEIKVCTKALVPLSCRQGAVRGLWALRGGKRDDDVIADAFGPFDPRDSDDDALLRKYWDEGDATNDDAKTMDRWIKLREYGEALGIFDPEVEWKCIEFIFFLFSSMSEPCGAVRCVA